VSRNVPQNKPEALRQLLQFFKAGGADGGAGPGTGTGGGDTDGDGFPNELEDALGTSPSDPNSTPFGGAPAGTSQPLTLTKFSLRMDFARDARDQLSLAGTLPVPASYDPTDKSVGVFVGGVAAGFTLNAKGASPRGNNAFKLLLKKKKGVVDAQNAKFMATFGKGTFRTQLADEKLDGSADARGETRSVNAIVLFNQTAYQATLNLSFSARKGKSGMAKMAVVK